MQRVHKDHASVRPCWTLHAGHDWTVDLCMEDKIFERKNGWSSTDTSASEAVIGSINTTVHRIGTECDFQVSNSRDAIVFGSEVRRLEHNRCHYTRSWCGQFRKTHSPESIFISLRLPRQLSQLKLSRGFHVLSPSMTLRLNPQGVRRNLWPVVTFRPAKYLPNQVWCFSVLSVIISFSDSVCNHCLPSRSCSHEGDAWASSPCFSPLRVLLLLDSEPARHLLSRQQSSTRLLRKVQTNRVNHLFAMEFADRSMGADNINNGNRHCSSF